MVEYTVTADSLEELGNELVELGIVAPSGTRWDETIETFERLLSAVETAHERTDGHGNQQSKIARYAGLEDEYGSHRVGAMLDVLTYFGHVEKTERRYHLPEE